jgi:very-short-patch-repair endonuclease
MSYQREFPLGIGLYRADFFVPSKNLVIEVDGDYWHSRPGCKEFDEARDARVREGGYTVIRFRESAIRKQIGQVFAQVKAAVS